MWIAFFAVLFAPLPALVFLIGCVLCVRGGRSTNKTGRIVGAGMVTASLLGRHWIRWFRSTSADDPQVLEGMHHRCLASDGVVLAWQEMGPPGAPTLFLVHGWSLTQDTWYYQKEALSKTYRVVVFDLRGTGRSTAPTNDDYSQEALEDDILRVYAACCGSRSKPCLWIGHSIGAMLIPSILAKHPELQASVKGAVLLNGTDQPLLQTMAGRRWLVPTQKWIWEPLAHLMIAVPRVFDFAARLLWQTGCVHMALMFGLHMGRESRGQNDLVAYRCGHFSMKAAALGALTCMQFDIRGIMGRVKMPVILVSGDCDVNTCPDIQYDMAKRLPDARVVILKNCGHLSLLECHRQVNDIISDFASQVLRPS